MDNINSNIDQKHHNKSVDAHVSLLQPVGSLTYGTELPPVVPGYAPSIATPKDHNRRRRLFKRIMIVILVIMLSGVGWVGWKVYNNLARATGDNNLFGLFGSVPLRNTDGRTNILLAGYSVDDPGHSGASLTDSLMVLSVNKTNNTAVVISIPRDLWTYIPEYGYQKINAVYNYGEESEYDSNTGYADGGMGLLQSIVSKNLGIDIHYYALINYTAFKDAVDAVGGITVDLRSPDNPYGLYDPYANLKLPNDVVNLDGQTALNLARSRGDGPGAYGFPRADFNRSEHQRKMLIALKEKTVSSNVLANPLKVGQLADSIGKNIKTDIKNNELNSMVSLLKKIDTNNIVSGGLNDLNGKNYLSSYAAPGGLSALIPSAGVDDYSDIQTAIEVLFNPPQSNTTPAADSQ